MHSPVRVDRSIALASVARRCFAVQIVLLVGQGAPSRSSRYSLPFAWTAVCGQSCIIGLPSAIATCLDGSVMFCESMRDFRAH
jgi:hypothetical protein